MTTGQYPKRRESDTQATQRVERMRLRAEAREQRPTLNRAQRRQAARQARAEARGSWSASG